MICAYYDAYFACRHYSYFFAMFIYPMLPLRGASCVTMLSSVLSFCHVSTLYALTALLLLPPFSALSLPAFAPVFAIFSLRGPMLSHPPTLAQLRFACSAKLSSPPPAPLPWPSNGAGYAAHPTLPFVSRPPPATNVAFFVALSFALLTAFLCCKINKQSIKISQSAVCIFQNNNNNNISQ